MSGIFLGYWPWARGIPLWGESFTSLTYSEWLETLSHAWSSYSAIGTSLLYYPASQGQFAIFTACPWTSTYYWLQFMSFLEGVLGSLTNWFYLHLCFIAPFLGGFYLAWVWTKKKFWLSALAGFLLMTSPITLERLMAGVTIYPLSIGLFALQLALYIQFGRSASRLKNAFIFVALFLVSGAFTALIPHFLVIFGVWWLFDFIFPKVVKADLGEQPRTAKLVALAAVIVGTVLLSLSIWYPPSRFVFPTNSIKAPYFQLRSLLHGAANSTYLKTITLSSGGVENELKLFDQYPFAFWCRWLFPLVVFLGGLFLLKRYRFKEKCYIYLAILFALATVISVGSQPPFGKMFIFAFKNIPGFSIFRDQAKFLILSVISFLLVLVDLMAELKKSIKRNYWIGLTVTTVALLVSFLTVPYLYFGKLREIVGSVVIPPSFFQLADYLRTHLPDNSRVFIWPDFAQIDSELNLKTPKKSFQKSVFTGLIKNNLSYLNPTGDNNYPSSEYLLYLNSMISQGLWSQARDYFGLEYVIQNKKLSGNRSLSNEESLHKEYENSTFRLYKINHSERNRLFVEEKPTIVSVGHPGYFLYQHSISAVNLDPSIIKQEIDKKIPLLVYDQSWDDLIMELVDEKYYLDPASVVRHNIGTDWQVFGGEDELLSMGIRLAGKHSIVTDHPADVDIFFKARSDSEIYVKAFNGRKNGNFLKFFINGKLVSSIELSGNNLQEYSWFRVGEVPKGRGVLKIRSTRAERALIDEIVLVPIKERERVERQLDSFLAQRQNFLYYTPGFRAERTATKKVFTGDRIAAISEGAIEKFLDSRTGQWFAALGPQHKDNSGQAIFKLSSDRGFDRLELISDTVYANSEYPVRFDYRLGPDEKWMSWSAVTADDPDKVHLLQLPEKVKAVEVKLTLSAKQGQGSAQVKQLLFRLINSNESEIVDNRFASFKLLASQEEIGQKLSSSDRRFLSVAELNSLKLTGPELIINLESYDPNWRLGEVAPVHALGYAQGYFVDRRSQIGPLHYLPEPSYRRTLIITKTVWFLALSLLAILGLVWIFRRSNNGKKDYLYSIRRGGGLPGRFCRRNIA